MISNDLDWIDDQNGKVSYYYNNNIKCGRFKACNLFEFTFKQICLPFKVVSCRASNTHT